MSKHAAPMNIRTYCIESTHQETFGRSTPDRNGKHRAVTAEPKES